MRIPRRLRNSAKMEIQQKNPTAVVQKPAPLQSRLPVRVICVVKSIDEPLSAPVQEIKKFCLDLNLFFETREFDSWKFTHDRDNIERLPAFHIYRRTIYERTFYPDTRPYQHIAEIKAIYVKGLEKKAAKVGKWNFWSRILAYIKRLRNPPSKLDRATVENTVRNSRRSIGAGGRTVSMQDWE